MNPRDLRRRAKRLDGGQGDDTGWLVNGENLQRSRLRVDTRKWLLSKALPKIYGDKLALGGDQDAPPITLRTIKRVIVRPGDQNCGVESASD
jgi:hypothetical protein